MGSFNLSLILLLIDFFISTYAIIFLIIYCSNILTIPDFLLTVIFIFFGVLVSSACFAAFYDLKMNVFVSFVPSVAFPLGKEKVLFIRFVDPLQLKPKTAF